MERQFQCPSCGAGNIVTNPGIVMKVCDYCKTAMYWDKDAALSAGQKSMDLPLSSRFKIGQGGKIRGQSFRVLGRLAYAHANGHWNEWFVELQDGKILWLTEDEGELFLESRLDLKAPVPPHGELTLGMKISLNDTVGIVEEIGEARCLGGEGQIPFRVEIGEAYPYADGSTEDGTTSFGLEYDPQTGAVKAFIGRILGLKADKVKSQAREAPVERTGEIIRCPSCGKPYEGRRVETTSLVVCDSCGAALHLDEAETRVVGKNKGPQPKFTFRIGLPLKFDDTVYEVMGRAVYVEIDEGIEYTTHEYVLYNPEAGYLWLEEDHGHYVLSRVVHTRPSMPSAPTVKSKVQVGNEMFRVFEIGNVTLRWIDGAFPWKAVVGESTRYTHLIKPPECLDEEITGKEVELFRGRYISREEMRKAVPEGVALPEPQGINSSQPFVSTWASGLWQIALAFLVLNALLWCYSMIAEKRTPVLKEQVKAADYSQEYLSQPFRVDRDRTIMRLEGNSPLNNSWLALDFGLVDAQERVISDFGNEASYYHGQDSEGSWTEGSKHFSSYFKVDKAGTYNLLIHGKGGSGEKGPQLNEPLDISLVSGVTISWFFIFPIVAALVFLILEPLLRWNFEQRRWRGTSAGGGDDDD
jgi:uncharacterized protein (DUF983 family)